jgi:hypothetical protein
LDDLLTKNFGVHLPPQDLMKLGGNLIADSTHKVYV